MELLSLLFGIILGIFLTIGDGFANEVRSKFGGEAGRLAWMMLVAAPIVFAMYQDRNLGLVAAAACAVLVHFLQLQTILEARKSTTSLRKVEAAV
jgi:hypothetical protein